MLNDKEINSIEEDMLGMNESVLQFIKKYIESEFSGSLLLSGRWGIGKTSFLNNVEAKIKPNKPTHFVKINFWLEDWDAKPSELIVKNLFPVLFWVIKFLPIIITLILALLTAFIQLLPSGGKLTSNSIVIWLFLVIMTSISTIILDKFSTEAVFNWILSVYLNSSQRNKKIIFIFDDFDRIEKEKRMILHSTLFNLSLYKNVVLIIVGEYSKIAEKENDSLFTQKIIGTVVNMPLGNMSSNVWKSFEKMLSDYHKDRITITGRDKSMMTFIRETFISEKRTMREAKQLFNIFETKYFDFNSESLNYGEQLAICYIFQFHNKFYEWIIDNQNLIYGKKFIPYKNYTPRPNDKKMLVLKEEILKELDDIYNDKLLLLVFNMFTNLMLEKLSYPSLSEARYFQLYQIQSTNSDSVLSIIDVENIVFEKKSDINLVKKIISDGKMDQFYYLFNTNFLKYRLSDPAYIDSFEELLKTITILNVTEIRPVTTLTTSYTKLIFDELLEHLVNVYSKDMLDLFSSLILEDDRLDLSEKIFALDQFHIYEVNMNKENVIVQLFDEFDNKDIIELKKPNLYYYKASEYYGQLSDCIKEKIRLKLEEFLLISPDEFYSFIKKHSMYNIVNHSNSNLVFFQNSFKQKIDELSENQKNDIYTLTKMNH